MRPSFTVSDWDATLPLMQSLADMMATQELMSLSDWTRTDEDLMWRSSFQDVDAMMLSLDRIAPLLSLLDAGPAPLNALEFHGSAENLEKIKQALPKIKAADMDINFYDSGTGLQMGSTDDRSALPLSRTACASHPRFTVLDWSQAEPIMQKFITETTGEEGCAHFGWTRSGDSLQWHGHYVDGDALKRHFEITRPLLDQLRSGPAVLEDMHVHGPPSELEKVASQLDGIEQVRFFRNEEQFPRLGDYKYLTAPRLM
jgi:quinol monooxygenase YgiN